MSSVKISELSAITAINANTANTLLMGVDIPTGVTGKFTAHTLAQGLYSNEVLNVGTNHQNLPNTVAQFSLSGNSYIQTNLVNTNDGGSADIVVTANTGTDSTYFVDFGYANKDYEAGSEFNNIGTAVNRLDGYIYAQGSTSNTWGGNLIVGSTTTGKEIRFIAGGGTTENVVARMNSSAIILNRGLVFADGTVQNTSSGSAGTYANAAFLQANTPSYTANSASLYANAAFLKANTPSYTSNSAASYANGAFIQANAAYTKANSALANTSGTFGGSLAITGDLSLLNGSVSTSGNMTVNGTIVMANSNFSATEAAVTIKATTNVALPSNDGYMIHISGKQNTASRIVFDSYSVTGNAYGLVAGRTARGTVDSPLAVANTDVLMRISGNGHGGLGAGWTTTGVARIDIVATENYSSTNRGSQIQFWNCPIGSNTLQQIATFNGNDIHFSGVVNPQKGFIYTPNNITTNSTTYTVDFNRDSMIRMSVNDNMTISLQNYVTGKLVEVWITNSAAQNKTITHGCLANNSTSKQTTFTVQSLSCAYLRYFSIDGDQANTFVSIVS